MKKRMILIFVTIIVIIGIIAIGIYLKPEKEDKVEKRRTKLLLKERKALNHLSQTCSLISTLNNDDITMMKNIKENR